MVATDSYEGMLAETIVVPGQEGDLIHAYQARPIGPGPFPAVVLSTIDRAGIRGTGRRLASSSPMDTSHSARISTAGLLTAIPMTWRRGRKPKKGCLTSR